MTKSSPLRAVLGSVFTVLMVLVPLTALAAYQGGSVTLFQPPPETLDPAQVRFTTDFGLACQLFEGLVEYNPLKGEVEPCLASSWEVGQDGRVYTFHLQQGVTFSDGRPLTSQDVKASIERFIKLSQLDYMQGLILGGEKLRSGKASDLEGVDLPDLSTVRIRLTQPVGFLIPALAPILITPKDTPGHTMDWQKPVGTGPFKLSEWKKDDYIKLVRNPSYRVQDLPHLDSVRINLRSGSDSLDFEKGRIAATTVPYSAASAWMDDDYYRSYVRVSRELGTSYVSLNTKKEPFDNRLVRQALNYLLDLEAAGMAQGAEFTRLGGIMSPDMPGYLHTAQPYDFNIAKAKELLAKAGFKDTKNFPRLSLICPNQSSKDLYDAAWGASLKKVGIKYTSTVLAMAEIDSRTEKGNYMAIASTWAPDYIDPDAMFYALMHPASRNSIGFSTPEVTSLIEQGRALTDEKERTAVYNKLQTLVHDLAPMVFGWSETRYTLVDPTLVNWERSPSADLPLLKYVWSDSPRYTYSTTDVASAPTAYTEALRALEDKNWTHARHLLAETRVNFPDYRNQSTAMQIIISMAQARAVVRSGVMLSINPQLEGYLMDAAFSEQFLDLQKGDLTIPFGGFALEDIPWARTKGLDPLDAYATGLTVDTQKEFMYCAEYVQGHNPKPLTGAMAVPMAAANLQLKPALLYRLMADTAAQARVMPDFCLWLYDKAIWYASDDKPLEEELRKISKQVAKEVAQW